MNTQLNPKTNKIWFQELNRIKYCTIKGPKIKANPWAAPKIPKAFPIWPAPTTSLIIETADGMKSPELNPRMKREILKKSKLALLESNISASPLIKTDTITVFL